MEYDDTGRHGQALYQKKISNAEFKMWKLSVISVASHGRG